ncbi:hypothetical protein PAMC26510_33585 [Caballeronia sordidicola]|uniref:Uncharacterized protein n=1 Tax=Caballeronia sordidicola TaxID=196367 RepID=A0A242M6X0_CABSO|nr:hypothetical protein PAMC26510_33585 [Caballeronia sordidicola]
MQMKDIGFIVDRNSGFYRRSAAQHSCTKWLARTPRHCFKAAAFPQ